MHPTQYETLLQKIDGLTNEIIQLRTEIETLKKSTRKTKKSPQSFPTPRNWQTVFQIT